MPHNVQLLFLPALVIAAALAFLWQRHAFIVWLNRGEPCLLKGKVTRVFIDEVAEICREADVRRGWIGGVRRGKRVVLVFSWHFPAPVRQRLRNLWMRHA